MKKLIPMLCLLVCFKFALTQVQINGELRPRAELRYGYRTQRGENDRPAFFIDQRSRLNFKYVQNTNSALISIQDVRVWGDEKFNTFNPSLALHQAWFKFNILDDLSLKVGRQTFSYDNNKILATSNWNQTSKKHDAVTLSFKQKKLKIDFINAFNQNKKNLFGTDYLEQQSNYKYLSSLWASYRQDNYTLLAYSLVDGFETSNQNVVTRITSGATLLYKMDNDIVIKARGAYQGGELVEEQQISSCLVNFESIIGGSNSNLVLGFELTSGDDLAHADGKSHIFQTPYGAKHRLNGTMDYFKKPQDTDNTGLFDGYLKWKKQLGNELTLGADVHIFSSEKKYIVDNEVFDKYLATEVDLLLNHSISEELQLECGYSVLKGSSVLQEMRGGDFQKLNHWTYVMLTFKPEFL